MEDKEITFVIVRRLGELSGPARNGWVKELNLVSWNGRDPKYDIREWSPEHDKMSRGVTLTKDEAASLVRLFSACLARG
jgi:hypothetical protein